MSSLVPTNGPSGVSAAQQQALCSWLAASRLMANQMGRETRANTGVSVGDFEIITRLAMSPGNRMRMSELADRTQSSRSRLSHQIDRMEKNGIITREDCDEDKRGSFAVLTRDGLELWRRTTPAAVEGIREHFFNQLSNEELRVVSTVFTRLEEYLEDLAAKPVSVVAPVRKSA